MVMVWDSVKWGQAEMTIIDHYRAQADKTQIRRYQS